jgi:hypothetical protein
MCQVPYLITFEALVRWPLLGWALVCLDSVAIGSSALVSLLSWGMRAVAHVHRYHHVVHPWWCVGRVDLSQHEASCSLGISWLKVQLAVIVAEVLEIRCILCD